MQYLVITSDNGHIEWNLHKESLEREAIFIWDLYRKGIVRNLWFTKDKNDAILLFEAAEKTYIEKILHDSPLAGENLLLYQIIELTSYTGFERIFRGTD